MARIHYHAVSSHAADYAARGRAHCHLPLAALARKWTAAFRAAVRSPGRRDIRAVERDLSAEFKLRNLAPPYHQVEDDRQRLIAEIADQFEVLRTSLPDDFAMIQAVGFNLVPGSAHATGSERAPAPETSFAAAGHQRAALKLEPARPCESQRAAGFEGRGSN
jgi:hypothetical protein